MTNPLHSDDHFPVQKVGAMVPLPCDVFVGVPKLTGRQRNAGSSVENVPRLVCVVRHRVRQGRVKEAAEARALTM